MKSGFQHTSLDVQNIPRVRKIVQLISGLTGIVVGARDGWIASHLNRFYAGESAPFVTLFVSLSKKKRKVIIWSISDEE